MKTITVHIGKGGDGKTSLSLHLATGLAEAGKRVMLIDADVQGHSTWALGHKAENCLYRLMLDYASWDEVLRYVNPAVYLPDDTDRKPVLFVLPGNRETGVITLLLHDDQKMRNKLAELESHFDYVIADTSPEAGLFVGSILLASDYILIPCKPEPLSLKSLRDTMASVGNRQGLQVLGIQPTMYDGRRTEDVSRLQDMISWYGDKVWSPIADRTAWVGASGQRRVVWKSRPNSQAASDARSFVDRAMLELGEVQVAKK